MPGISLHKLHFSYSIRTPGTDASGSGSTIHDNDPETLEMEKQRNLKGEQDHTSAPHKQAPGWNEHLASTSEAFIKVRSSTAHAANLLAHVLQFVLFIF